MELQAILILTLAVSFAACQVPTGRANMVMIGGGLDADNPIIYPKIVELAGGNGSAICVLTMAADNPESEGAKFVARLNNWGANATWIPVVQSNQSSSAYDPVNVEALRGCVGFFFCGGTRSRVLNALRRGGVDSPSMSAIREQLRKGAVLAGTSAGMATQGSRVTILTGETYDSVTFKNYTLNTDGGLGTFEFPYMLDAHCSEYGREGRLVRIMFDTQTLPKGVTMGIHVDEDHALVVSDLYGLNGRPKGTVIGTVKGVHIYDVADAILVGSTTTDLRGVRETFMSVDDEIDMLSGVVTIAGYKGIISTGVNTEIFTSTDIFSTVAKPKGGLEWLKASQSFIDARSALTSESTSSETSPGFVVTIDRAVAIGYKGTNPSSGAVVYSWKNMLFNIRPASP